MFNRSYLRIPIDEDLSLKLLKTKLPIPYDAHCFLMLNCAADVRETEWEGMASLRAFHYYKDLLFFPAHTISHGLTDEALATAREVIEDLIIFETLIQANDIEGILAKIQSRHLTYFPAGYCGDPIGHFEGLKHRRLDDGRYACSILDQGEGLLFHRMISTSNTTKPMKPDYQYHEYAIDFKKDSGKAFLESLLLLRTDRRVYERGEENGIPSNSKTIRGYSALDVYGLLACYGEPLEPVSPTLVHAVTPQRSGTCTMTNTKTVIRDALISLHKLSVNEVKRFHFVVKQSSLIAAYQAYQSGQCAMKHLAQGLREYQVRITKHYPEILTEEELKTSTQIAEIMTEHLLQDQQKKIIAQCTRRSLPPLKGEWQKPASQTAVNIEREVSRPPVELSDTIILSTDIPTPEAMLDFLKQAANYLAKSKIQELTILIEIRNFMRSLPATSGEEVDPYWDHVPSHLLNDVISTLATLVEFSSKKSKENSQVYLFEIALIAYDIAAQLAPHSDVLKMGREYALTLDDVYSSECFYFDAFTYHTVKRIVENFHLRTAGKQSILGNAVNYDPLDKTENYVFKTLLTAEKERAAIDLLKHWEMSPWEITQNYPLNEWRKKELFKIFMTGECYKRQYGKTEISSFIFPTKEFLSATFADVLMLSAASHSKGKLVKQYAQDADSAETDKLLFNCKIPFHREKILPEYRNRLAAETAKHFPAVDRWSNVVYQDFSENTVYHPFNDFVHNHLEAFYPEEKKYQPYPLYPTGTFHPDENKRLNPYDVNSLELDEALRAIECAPALQIQNTLEWMQYHIDKLLNNDVKNIVFNKLFSYGRLDHALKTAPSETLSLMVHFLKTGFNCYHYEITEESNGKILFNQSTETFFWLCGVQVHLKQHVEVAAGIYHFSLDDVDWPNLGLFLVEKLKTEIRQRPKVKLAFYLMLCYRGVPELSFQDCVTLLMCRLLTNLESSHRSYDYLSDELDYLVEEVWLTHRETVVKTLSANPIYLDDTANLMLEKCLNMTGRFSWRLKGKSLSSITSDFAIDLHQGLLLNGNEQVRDHTLSIHVHPIFNSLPVDKTQLKLISNGYRNTHINNTSISLLSIISPDKEWDFRLSKLGDVICVFRSLLIEGARKEFQLLYLEEVSSYFSQRKLYSPLDVNEHKFFVDLNDNLSVFVCHHKECTKGYYYTAGQVWREMTVTAGHWQSTHHGLLDLTCPVTDLEKSWSTYLANIVGLDAVKVEIIFDHHECAVSTLVLSKLNLGFTVANGLLMSDNFTGYYLSSQPSIAALNGLQSTLILENAKGCQKYIVPAFALKKVNKSQALKESDFIDRNALLEFSGDQSVKYFIYDLAIDGTLQGDCIEADFYLSIIYRCQGDYERAMQALLRTEHYTNNNPDIDILVKQLINYQDLSPLGAAYDCKVACRMFRHKDKWSKSGDSWISDHHLPDFVSHALKQYDYYENTTSSRKQGVSIFPQYLRLSEEESEIMLKFALIVAMQRNEMPKNKFIPQGNFNTEQLVALSKHDWFEKGVSTLGTFYWPRAPHQKLLETTFVRIYCKDNDALVHIKNKLQNHPALQFLKSHYKYLFLKALSSDSDDQYKLRAKLFILLHNDMESSPEILTLIASLICVLNHPEEFKDISEQDYDDSESCFDRVQSRYRERKKRITKRYLLKPLEETSIIVRDFPLPSPLLTEPQITFISGSCEKFKEGLQLLKPIWTTYFVNTPRVVATREFQLEAAAFSKATPIILKIFNRYQQGHLLNQKRVKPVYTFKPDVSLLALRSDLLQDRQDSFRNLQTLRTKITIEANSVPSTKPGTANLLLTVQQSEQLPAILVEDFLMALSTGRAQDLVARNPLLTQENLTSLLRHTYDYIILQTRIDQIDDALAMIGNKQSTVSFGTYDTQLLGAILDKRRHMRFVNYPGWLAYEFATKFLIRPDQSKALIDLISLFENQKYPGQFIEEKHALLQFPAGSGKSILLIPALAQEFARREILPVIVLTPELYHVNIEVYAKNMRLGFKLSIEVIERELEHEWTAKEFQKLYQDLESWRLQCSKCVIIKSVTWHSIHIAKRIAQANNDTALAISAKRVLNFFKYKSAKLEDEGHLVSDPLQECIKTYGPLQSVSRDKQKLLIRFFDILMGRVAGSEKIAEKAGILMKGKTEINEEDVAFIQAGLIHHIVKEAFFENLDVTSLCQYLRQLSCVRPQWLKNLRETNPALEDLVVLARAFIKTLCPRVLSMQFSKDYGTSVHSHDLTAAPKHDGSSVTSHFADPMLVMVLTILLYEIIGVPAEYIKKILQYYVREDHLRERQWNLGTSQVEIDFNRLLPDDYPYLHLDDLTENTILNLTNDQRIAHHGKVISLFLLQYVFPQIRTPKYRMVSTPAHLQAGFNRSIIFTATPGLLEIFPVFLSEENCLLDDQFEPEVIDTLLQEKNSDACLIDMTHSPEDFFKQLHNACPDLFRQLTTLIDRGAILSDVMPRKVIEAFLDILQLEKRTASAVCYEEQYMLLLSHLPKLHDIKISGVKLHEALASRGVSSEDTLVFLFLALCHTTGVDNVRSAKDRAGETIGRRQTITQTIQASMRERLLLWSNAHTIFWVMFKKLYEEINPGVEKFDLKPILYWMLRNEGEDLETKVIARAYQGIYQQIEAVIIDDIDAEIVSYQQYADRLQKTSLLSISDSYELEATMKNASSVCWEYVEELCKYFDLGSVDQLPVVTKQYCTKIIAQTSALVQLLRQPRGAEIRGEITQNQETLAENLDQIEQQQKTKSRFDSYTIFKFALEQYGTYDVFDCIFNQLPEKNPTIRYQNISLIKCEDIKLPSLLICKSHFSPFEDNDPGPITCLKPIKHLLVKINSKSIQFVACTFVGAAFFERQIFKHDGSTDTNGYAIIGMDGHIFCASASMTKEQKQQLLRSDELLEMLTFTMFLNGKIRNPYQMQAIVSKYGWQYSDYERLVTAIHHVHVSKQPIQLQHESLLYILCGWKRSAEVNKVPVKRSENSQLSKMNLLTLTKTTSLPPRISDSTQTAFLKSPLPAYLLKEKLSTRPLMQDSELMDLINRRRAKRETYQKHLPRPHESAPPTIEISLTQPPVKANIIMREAVAPKEADFKFVFRYRGAECSVVLESEEQEIFLAKEVAKQIKNKQIQLDHSLRIYRQGEQQYGSLHQFFIDRIARAKYNNQEFFALYYTAISELLSDSRLNSRINKTIGSVLREEFLNFVIDDTSGLRCFHLLTKIGALFTQKEDYQKFRKRREAVWQIIEALDPSSPETLRIICAAGNVKTSLGYLFCSNFVTELPPTLRFLQPTSTNYLSKIQQRRRIVEAAQKTELQQNPQQ